MATDNAHRGQMLAKLGGAGVEASLVGVASHAQPPNIPSVKPSAGGGRAADGAHEIRPPVAAEGSHATGSLRDVEHVVMLMMENRSFDSYFGMLRGVRGFGDRFPMPLQGGRTAWQQGDGSGSMVLPYRLDQERGNAQRGPDVDHDWASSQNAWDGGRQHQWPRHKGPEAMGAFSRAEIPFQYALADAFTVCDAYHASMHTATICNRLFFWTGTNGPSASGTAVVRNEFDEPNMAPSREGFTWKTYPERLQDASISWKVYQNMPDSFSDNQLMSFRQYRRANEAAPPDRRVSSDPDAMCPPYDPAIDDPGNPLFKGIGNTLPDAGMPSTFRDDVRSGRLPQVSWIVTPAAYSEHAERSCPVQGAWYVQEVLDAMSEVPEVWRKSVLFVNFDENGGFFDHIPSPSAPSIRADATPAGNTTLPETTIALERFTQEAPPGALQQPPPDGRVYGPGIRVPMLVISPWSCGGWGNSEVFDHTSILRFLEARFGVAEPHISPYRRAVCGDLLSAFDFTRPDPRPPREIVGSLAGRKTKAEADALREQQERMPSLLAPKGDHALPPQEPGVRPSRALPYELRTTGRAEAAAQRFRLNFANTGRAGAVFHVYDKRHLDRLPCRYMVEHGKALDDVWSLAADEGQYDLWVLGPNGYHRHYRGNVSDFDTSSTAADPEVDVAYDVPGTQLGLTLHNRGGARCVFTVHAEAYRDDGPWQVAVEAGSSADLHWSLAESGQWYDFSIVCEEQPSFYRRVAGRMETGRDTVSDPSFGALQ